MPLYISQIKLPNDENTYYIKDSEARDLIAQIQGGALVFVKSVDAASTPYGVQWNDHGTTITGTLVASSSTEGKIYLVPQSTGAGKDIFAEYVTVTTGGSGTEQDPYVYAWEKLGDTEIDFSALGALAYVDSITLNKQTDSVLGADTTFTAAASSVTFTGGTDDTFVKSYPGTTSKLETTSIKGVGASDVTFNAVDGTPGTVTATNTVFGTDTTASKVVTTSKTATNLVLGTATTASKATADTAVALAKAAAAATNVSYIGNANTSSVLETASVSGEVLTFGSAAVAQSSVTGTNGTETITPYTFTDVTVPVVTSNTEVTFDAVSSATDVTVPVVSSNAAVTASEAITIEPVTAATSAANAITVATGLLDSADTVGATVMTGLGTAVTATAVTGLGTAEAAAQTITVGTNDQVTALTSATDLTVTPHSNN